MCHQRWSQFAADCSRLQQNNSTELPVDCKAGGPSAAEGTEPAPLCAINAGRSLQPEIAADCSRTTRRSCPLIARLAGRLQLKARSQRRYVPSTLVAVCQIQIAAEQLDGVAR